MALIDLDPELILRVNHNKISMHNSNKEFHKWKRDKPLPIFYNGECYNDFTGVALIVTADLYRTTQGNHRLNSAIVSLSKGQLHNPYSFAEWPEFGSCRYSLFGNDLYFSDWYPFHKGYIKCATIEERDNFCGYWLSNHTHDDYGRWTKVSI